MNTIRTEALGRDFWISVSPGQLLTKITSGRLTKLRGDPKLTIKTQAATPRTLIWSAGCSGSGKEPTFRWKKNSEGYLKKQRKNKCFLVACDIYSSCAIDSVGKCWGEQIGVEVYCRAGENKKCFADRQVNCDRLYAKKTRKKTVIIDYCGSTLAAGWSHRWKETWRSWKRVLNPLQRHFYVVDSEWTGQDSGEILQRPSTSAWILTELVSWTKFRGVREVESSDFHPTAR